MAVLCGPEGTLQAGELRVHRLPALQPFKAGWEGIPGRGVVEQEAAGLAVTFPTALRGGPRRGRGE